MHLTRKNYKILLTQTHIASGQICCDAEKLLLMDKLNNVCWSFRTDGLIHLIALHPHMYNEML